MSKSWNDIKEGLSWLPAFAFPMSHIVQIFKMFEAKSALGVSPITFAGYFFGNMGAYIFSEKYIDARTLMGFISTALLEIVIVSMVGYYTKGLWATILPWIIGLIIGAVVFFIIRRTKQKKLEKYASVAGYFPAILFPLASVAELIRAIRSPSLKGLSCSAWVWQILANIGAYFLIGKFKNFKNISGFLGTALMDVIILIVMFARGTKISECLPWKF